MKLLLFVMVVVMWLLFTLVVSADCHKVGEDIGYNKGFEDGRKFEAKRHEDDGK